VIAQPLSRRFLIVVADLSLILFLVCAAALQDGPADVPASAPAPREAPVMLSVWSDVPGGITLREWLAQQPPDDSQRLSIEVSYGAGGFASALARADQLRLAAGPVGANARVLIAEGPQDAVLAQLVQDHAQTAASGTDVALLGGN
jgi:hypothetical protein